MIESLGLDRVVRFRMYFDGKGAASMAGMMGAAFFLRVAYYFGFGYFGECGAAKLILDLIIPVLLFGSVAVLVKGFRIGLLRVYGIFAAVNCVMMMVWTFDLQSIMHFVLAVLWYLITIAVIAATVGGYISNRLILQLAFLLPMLYRFFLFDLGEYVLTLKLVDFLPEASNLCALIGWSSFARCLIPERLHFINSEK